MMESIYMCKLASRGWHFYGRNIWANTKEGKILFAEKEKRKIVLMHDLYAVSWKIKSKGKLVADAVGHVPLEISWAVAFFLCGGKLNGKVSDAKYRHSPISKGELEIPLSGKENI